MRPEGWVVGLQTFHVLFLLLHDWVPLGGWNDVAAWRRKDTIWRSVVTTLVSTAPFAWLLWVSWHDLRMARFPLELRVWLWIGYGCLFAGEIRAWWIPYVFGGDSGRRERYKAMFGRTYGFLPERHGIRPNALHVVLHLATACLLVLLFLL